VQHSDALDALKQNLEQVLTASREYGIKKENRPFHPHVTLATRDLEKSDFFEAWQHFKDMPHQESWEVQGISILRHNGRSWDVHYTAFLKSDSTTS
jgi:2'-5' RNA ligase